MDDEKDKRRTERFACNVSAKVAFYVPLEYCACYGPNCFPATIVDYNENGFGVALASELDVNTVVNIFMNQACQRDENSPVDKVYPSKIKWIKGTATSGPEAFRIGVQHVR
jgi:hypothetical protein